MIHPRHPFGYMHEQAGFGSGTCMISSCVYSAIACVRPWVIDSSSSEQSFAFRRHPARSLFSVHVSSSISMTRVSILCISIVICLFRCIPSEYLSRALFLAPSAVFHFPSLFHLGVFCLFLYLFSLSSSFSVSFSAYMDVCLLHAHTQPCFAFPPS